MIVQKRSLAVAGVALVLLVAAGMWFYWRRMQKPEPLPESTAGRDAGLGAQIFEGAQNPLKGDVPETNPFSADTNPFQQDTNPYKDEYKNPF